MIVAQNNRYGTIVKVECKLMEFATEDEAIEIQREKEEEEKQAFSEILAREVRRLEAKHGRHIPIH